MEAKDQLFRVVMKSAGPVVFGPQDYIEIRDIGVANGLANATLRTEYIGDSLGKEIPGDLVIIVEGNAASLSQATNEFFNISAAISNLVSVSANCHVGHLELHAALEMTPGAEAYNLVLSKRQASEYHGMILRLMKSDDVGSVLKHFPQCAEQKRFGLAAQLYEVALQYWAHGTTPLPLEFLFMASEALWPAMVRQRCLRRQLDEKTLARDLGIDTSIDNWRNQFRCALIFRGDADVHRVAKATSDGIEHGFAGLRQVQEGSGRVIGQAFRYVREALFEVLTPDAVPQALFDLAPLDYLSGRQLAVAQVRDRSHVASSPLWYPQATWKSKARADEVDGTSPGIVDEDVEVRVADGMEILNLAMELRGRASLGSPVLCRSCPTVSKVSTSSNEEAPAR